jgi:hypothetical protein
VKGTDVTEAQLAHALEFLKQTGPVPDDLNELRAVRIGELVRLLAWYGAIRAKSGQLVPGKLVNHG